MNNDSHIVELSELIALCETSTLQKGIQLAQSGAVRRLKVEGDMATAQVKGTEYYNVSLNLGSALSGDCSCPAAQYQTLCKHAVAVALSLQNEGGEPNGESERSLIKSHLQSLGEEAILDKLLDYLEADEYEWNALLTKINLHQQPVAYGELKKLVTEALPREQIWDWRESSGYFHSAENQLLMIAESMLSLNVEQQWKLIYYIIERLNKVLEHIDDSSGDRFGIEELINTNMPKIFAKLNWSEEEKAQWMFERITSYEFDVFPSITQHFEAVWKDNDCFLNLCREAIERASEDDDGLWNLRSWSAPLIKQASDWREVIAIRQKTARTCQDCLDIVEIYIDNNEPLEAEFWLAKARKIANQYEQQACDQAQLQLYVELGEISAAWGLANRMFEQSPTFAHYQQLAKFQNSHNVDDPDFLLRVEQILKDAYQPPNSLGFSSKSSDGLVEFYIDRKEWNKACEWVATRKVSVGVLIKLADLVVGDKPENTLSYYLSAVTTHIEQTNNDAYRAALELLIRLESLLKPQPDQLANFHVEVSALANTYKRKRNMLKLLQQEYADYL